MKTRYLSIIAILFVMVFASTNIVFAHSMPVTLTQSPLKQFKSGIAANDVKCKQDLQLVIKSEDGSPACLTQDSISKLILRGWISTTPSLDQNNIIFGDFYQGIENDSGIVSIKNQTYYIITAANTTYPITSGMSARFHQITFSFPYGSLATPGGAITPFDMTFPDSTTEAYGKITKNQDGSGSMSGIGLGPGPFSNRTVTVLSDHMHPQAGVTMTEDQIKLLVSTDVNSTNSQTSEHITLPASFMPCDTPYPQSNTGVAVLYMPVNSIGKICVRYFNVNDIPEPIYGIRIFDPNNSNQNATGITTWNDLGNNYTISKGDSTVVYWINTGNQTGFYGLVLSCGGTPFAVGYDNNSRIVSSDFPFLGVTHSCPVMLYDSHIDSLTGIGVKYIPYP